MVVVSVAVDGGDGSDYTVGADIGGYCASGGGD